MSTQLLLGTKERGVFDAEQQTSGALPPQVYQFADVVDAIEEALVEKRISHNQAYRFKVLETIFGFFETKRTQLLAAASQDFQGKADRVELGLEYAFTLSQIGAALQSQCKPNVPGGALPDRFFKKLTPKVVGGLAAMNIAARPVGAVLIVAQPKRPFDDLFAPLVSAVAAGNAVCAVLTPTLPSLNKVIIEQLTPVLPKSAVFFVNAADMEEEKQGVAKLRASSTDVFGVQIPGTSHVATRVSVPGSAYLSASLAKPPSGVLHFSSGGTWSKLVQAKLKEIATEVVDGGSMLLGRGVGAPKYLFVHEEVYGSMRQALLLAIATSSASLCPRDDGSQLEELLLSEQRAGNKVGMCGGAARIVKPFASEKRRGAIALIEVEVEAARAAKLSAVISERGVVEQVKQLATLVLVGVSSTEHAMSLIEGVGLHKGHMVVYSDDSAEIQHVLRELEPASLSVNHVAPENLFSSYAIRARPDSAGVLHHHGIQATSEWQGLRWPLNGFQTSSVAYLDGVRSTSLGLCGVAASTAGSNSALSRASGNQRESTVRKALALHIAKTKRMVQRSRPTVAVPVLRVFFLQGLFLFWASALTCTLAGVGLGAFKLSHWAWLRYMNARSA